MFSLYMYMYMMNDIKEFFFFQYSFYLVRYQYTAEN